MYQRLQVPPRTWPDYTAKVNAVRRNPDKYRQALKDELSRLENKGIICKLDANCPTEWVNSMVIVPKPDGSIRLVMDPRDLNKHMKGPHHAVQTFDEVVSQHSNCKYFSLLDQKSGYWQLQLDDQSADTCTSITPHGRYQNTRLPMV